MELLPFSAPVYGGGLMVAFLPENYTLPDEIRAFLVFEGTQQRQVTEAKISIEDNALHAVIPDHEPPECVTLSAFIRFPDNTSECIAVENFTYFLDQTCYLAKYLADSVHDFESLEEWDNIRGENFSLEQEDFNSLDERLTSAFQHLILPFDWNLLGDASAEPVPRETLFHFAARLGLSTFVTLLLEKPGAEACLRLQNKHGELATDIAKERRFDGLADLITDPHAHGVIKWESKEEIGRAIILTRHGFGTVSTTVEADRGNWPPLSSEIEALCRSSGPPATPVPYMSHSDPQWDEGQNDSFYTYAPSHFIDDYVSSSHSELFPEQNQRPYLSSEVVTNYEDGPEPSVFLNSNINHLHEISNEIHLLRQKDLQELQEENSESFRASSSCPNLAQDDEDVEPPYEIKSSHALLHPPIMARNRKALSPDKEEELEHQLLIDDIHDYRAQQDIIDDDSSALPLVRRHSWHSTEDLSEDKTLQRRNRMSVSDGEDEDESARSSVTSPTVVRRGNRNNMATFSVVAPHLSPPIQGGGYDGGVSSVDGARESVDDVDENRRSSSLTVNNKLQVIHEPDRRHTFTEGFKSRDIESVKEEPVESSRSVQLQVASESKVRLPVPPRPPKNFVTRKISFLEKVKNSAKYKQKDKGKMKYLAELRFGSKKPAEESNSDPFNNIAEDPIKIKRPSIIDRPRSMMINKPTQYPVGNTSTSLTTNSPRSRPISQSHDGFQSSSSVTEVRRSSFYDEEDGLVSKLYSSSKNQNQLAGSCESLSDPSVDTADLENDPDLRIKSDEPDSWSATMDKKTLKKINLSKKDSKRQENIFEFIQTEKNHLTTLKILQLIYARGLSNELKMDQTTIQKLFPHIDKHVQYVSDFVKKLTTRQSSSKVVTGIGDVIVEQWEGTSGERMKYLFGDFCSKQGEITLFYKDLMKNDKKFQAFMKKCDQHRLTRRQDVPGCALLITQRLTKYPIMLQTMFENTNKKDHKDDHKHLERALELSREIAKDVDEQVQAHERQNLLIETYDKIDTKSATTFKDGNRKFDRKDFLKKNRKLLYSANLQYKDNKKIMDVFFLLLSDCIVLLQDSNGRYIFPTGQPAAIPLQKMIVREVANDEKALYLMSMRSQQMYTLMADTADHCKTLTNTIRLAIGKCPDEDEGVISEDEGERRSHDHRLDKAKQMLNQLALVDQRINRMLEEKMSYFRSLADNIGRGSAVANMHFYFADRSQSVDDCDDFPSGSPILAKASEQVQKLTNAFYGPGGFSRHSSSAGEHDSGPRSATTLPKRSDTFGGFDNGKEPSSSRAKYLNSSQSDSKLSDIEHARNELLPSNRDSGFHSELTVAHAAGSQTSIPSKQWHPRPSEGVEQPSLPVDEAATSYLSPTSEQVSALTSLAGILSDYQSFAAQQDTHVEKLQLQLAAGRKKTVGGGLQEAELKRNQIKQQEQMDDLRKQQQQFRVEREQWQKQVERFQRSLDGDQADLVLERERIKKEKEEIERERADIVKAKEEYQRELNRLRSLQRQAQPSHETSSSTSSLASTNKNNNNSESMALSNSHSTLYGFEPRSSKVNPSPTFSSGEYPRTFPGHKKDQQQQPNLPIHLQLSAANLTSNPQTVKTQDMSKLSKLASSSKTNAASKQASGEKGVIHQLIPHKLSKLANPPSSSKKPHIV